MLLILTFLPNGKVNKNEMQRISLLAWSEMTAVPHLEALEPDACDGPTSALPTSSTDRDLH